MGKIGPLVILALVAAGSVAAQGLSLTAIAPPVAVFAPNTDIWIGGTFTLSYSGTAAMDTVTDIAPASTNILRKKWIGIGATSKSVSMQSSQVYKVQAINSNKIVKQWGSESSVTSDNVYSYHFSSGPASVSFEYWVYIRNGTTPKSGVYVLPLTIETRAATFVQGGTPPAPAANATVNPSIIINQIADISITGPGGVFNAGDNAETIEFGELTTTSPKGFRLFVSSSFRYALNVKSLNKGALANEDPAVPESIPYALSINGNGVNLNAGAVVVSDYQSANSDSQPAQYEGVLTLDSGAAGALTPGSYTDSLTFSISAR